MINKDSNGSALTAAYDTALEQSKREFDQRFVLDGDVVDCDVTSVTCHKGSCGNSLSVGCVYASYIEVSLRRCEIDLEGEELIYQIGLKVGDDYTYIDVGHFTVVEPKRTVIGQVTFTAYSTLSMIGSNGYDTELTYPATINAVIDELDDNGVTVRLQGLPGTGVITKPLSGTYAEVLGTMAGLLGGFVTEGNDGAIVIARYNSGSVISSLPYRSLTHPEFREIPYTVTGIHVTVVEEHDEEREEEKTVTVEIEEYDEETGEMVIRYETETVIDVVVDHINEVFYEYGDPVNLIQTNAWMTEDLFSDMTQGTPARIVGIPFELASLDISLGDPRIEPWDMISLTDVNGDVHSVPCFEITHSLSGGLMTKVVAETSSEGETDTRFQGSLSQQVARLGSDVFVANQAAIHARRLAADAKDSADFAQMSANRAQRAADSAQKSADDAATAAIDANKAAGEAQGDATRANSAATAALFQLSEVENVLNTVNWLAEHGYYAATEDTVIDPYKRYYTVTATAVADPDFTTQAQYYELSDGKYVMTSDKAAVSGKTYYTLDPSAVDEPVVEDIGTYYEIRTDEAISQYVASHLSLTDRGLEVMADGNGYRLLLASDGAYIMDPDGIIVANYGESIFFDPTKPHRIGNDNVYIEYYASTPGGLPDSIKIKVNELAVSGSDISDTIGQMQRDMDSISGEQSRIDDDMSDIRTDLASMGSSSDNILIAPNTYTITISDGTNTSVLGRQQLEFKSGGNTTAVYAADHMEVPAVTATTINMVSSDGVEDLYWIMRANGHLTLKTKKGVS